jgi:dethiobiotin synthetase
MVLDVARWLGLPAVVVARAGLGTINHTLLTLNALRSAGVAVAGAVINRYPAAPDVAEQTNSAALERWGGAPVLCVVPEAVMPPRGLPVEVTDAVEKVQWEGLCQPSAGCVPYSAAKTGL